MKSLVRAREGDFLETVEGLIFDVKGLIHPPDRVIAYLRYLESPLGDRLKGGRRYAKIYPLSERERILRENYPHYIYYDRVFDEWLEGVPSNLIAKIYKPEERVSELLTKSELDSFEFQALKFLCTLRDYSNVPWGSIGLSGSILANLYTSESDIDVIVYGRRSCLTIYDSLRELVCEGRSGFAPYSLNDLKRLHEFRSKDTLMSFEKFYEAERRKVSQGKFFGRDFFVRFVLEWGEIDESYGDRLYRNAGYARIKARIEDDSESIFTPCKYVISGVKVLEGGAGFQPPREVVSFRGRFCEQARRGEWVIAQGKVERVIERDGSEYCRIILGNKPSDFMIIENSIS